MLTVFSFNIYLTTNTCAIISGADLSHQNPIYSLTPRKLDISFPLLDSCSRIIEVQLHFGTQAVPNGILATRLANERVTDRSGIPSIKIGMGLTRFANTFVCCVV